jgi:threonine dehydratase
VTGSPAARPTADDVARAASALRGRVVRTPTFVSAELSTRAGAPVHVKAELLQHTGSFKVRGAINRIDALGPEERARGVIAVSAGNHARAVAYACAQRGIDCVVVMWRGASRTKADAARELGATVDLEAGGPTEAFPRLEELRAESGRTLVHPFADPLVVAGAGTVGLELLEDVPDLAAVLVPVGGGGLLSGIATAIRAQRPDARILGVEPEGSTALAAGLAAGEPVAVVPASVADGLNAPFTSDLCIDVCRATGVELVTVSEAELADAFRLCYGVLRLAVEPAAAAGVAALCSGRHELGGAGPIALVISGGNVDPETASAILTGR